MINLEITSSPDQEKQGELILFLEQFTLGSSVKCNIYLKDPEVDETHLFFQHMKDGLLIKSLNDTSFFSNGKKFKGSKLHKAGDFFKIGDTEIKIVNLEFKNLSEDFQTIYERRLKENPELESLITQLQKELLYIETEKDV